MKLIKLIKRFFFTIHVIIWIIVHQIENWLYPYYDRPVDYMFDDDDNDEEIDHISYLYSQVESANERIQRLQSEMRYIFTHINLNEDKKTEI